MKKLAIILISALCLSACNNSGEGTNKNDSIEPDVNTGSMQESPTGDTSSYERMPQITSDTTQR